jgi:hypothetical protein
MLRENPISAILLSLFMAAPSLSVAQGQDSSPAERNLLVLAELLPGVYDNVNQHYFESRRGVSPEERHPRSRVTITRVDAPAFGEFAFLWVTRTGEDAASQSSWRIATLSADADPLDVTMRHYLGGAGVLTEAQVGALEPSDLRRTEGCDYFFRRRADHFHGVQRPRACRFDWDGEQVYTANFIQLSATSLWFIDDKFSVATEARVTGVASGEPFWLERTRTFHCYVDMPGVGGGRDEPFERYDGIRLDDGGSMHWITTRENAPREIGLRLQAVTWHVLNEAGGAFNRDSLVLYVMERLADGAVQSRGYAFTEPGAERIGVNQGWLLANCATVPRHLTRPEL